MQESTSKRASLLLMERELRKRTLVFLYSYSMSSSNKCLSRKLSSDICHLSTTSGATSEGCSPVNSRGYPLQKYLT